MEAIPGIEPGSVDSKSNVLTITPYRRHLSSASVWHRPLYFHHRQMSTTAKGSWQRKITIAMSIELTHPKDSNLPALRLPKRRARARSTLLSSGIEPETFALQVQCSTN